MKTAPNSNALIQGGPTTDPRTTCGSRTEYYTISGLVQKDYSYEFQFHSYYR